MLWFLIRFFKDLVHGAEDTKTVVLEIRTLVCYFERENCTAASYIFFPMNSEIIATPWM